MALCEYELQRLANIASNQAVLDSLGLGGDNSLKKPKAPVVRKPTSDDNDDDEKPPSLPTRRSTRNVGSTATYVELSDEFMCMEERGLLKRAKRNTKPTTPRFDELQAAEAAQRDEKRAHKAAQQAQVVKERMERERSERAERAKIAAEQRLANAHAASSPVPLMGFMPRSGGVPPYPTKGKVEVCPICNGPFVRRKNGAMRKHDCVDPTPWVPTFI